jgi:hypothetical protein
VYKNDENSGKSPGIKRARVLPGFPGQMRRKVVGMAWRRFELSLAPHFFGGPNGGVMDGVGGVGGVPCSSWGQAGYEEATHDLNDHGSKILKYIEVLSVLQL